MIEFAKKACGKGVIVVLNSCNTMEVAELADDEGINAIIQMCTPGALGFKSLGKIAAGIISGAGDNGTYCALKHFAMVDQEEQR